MSFWPLRFVSEMSFWLVVMSVLCAGVAFDPNAGAVGVMFLFPDRNGGLDGVDDSAAGCKGGIAMGSGDGNADGDFPDLEVSGAVLAASGDDVVFSTDLLDDTVTFFLGQ